MLNKYTAMGLFKVHQVKHLQDVAVTEAIHLD